MIKRKIFCLIVLIFVIFISAFMYSQYKKNKLIEGNIAFWTMNYNIHGLYDLISDYDNGLLDEDSLKAHYNNLDMINGIMSYSVVYEDSLIMGNLIENYSHDDINDRVIDDYRELLAFLEETEEELKIMDGNARLNAYDLFTSEEFNIEFKKYLERANN
jgi:hypothetical protein